jgi:uncharacterized protein HemY
MARWINQPESRHHGGGHQRVAHAMTNLLAQAINCDDADRAAKIIQDALSIEGDDVIQLTLP